MKINFICLLNFDELKIMGSFYSSISVSRRILVIIEKNNLLYKLTIELYKMSVIIN